MDHSHTVEYTARMVTVNVREAKTHLSRLLADVESGEEVLIARAGKVVARLCPVRRAWPGPGAWEGRVTLRADFDGPDPPCG